MLREKLLASCMAISLGLSACANGAGTNETIGTIGGAIVGAVIGAQFGDGTGQLVATALGTLAGAMIGQAIGRSMDDADRAAASEAYDEAAYGPVGEPVYWSNPQSGNYGTVVPVQETTNNDGSTCRQFQQTVVVDGEAQSSTGTACRGSDGTWRIL